LGRRLVQGHCSRKGQRNTSTHAGSLFRKGFDPWQEITSCKYRWPRYHVSRRGIAVEAGGGPSGSGFPRHQDCLFWLLRRALSSSTLHRAIRLHYGSNRTLHSPTPGLTWLAHVGDLVLHCKRRKSVCSGGLRENSRERILKKCKHLVCRARQVPCRCCGHLARKVSHESNSTGTMQLGVRTASGFGSCSRRSGYHTEWRRSTCDATETSQSHSWPRCREACFPCWSWMGVS
jgi:hypothetical protein